MTCQWIEDWLKYQFERTFCTPEIYKGSYQVLPGKLSIPTLRGTIFIGNHRKNSWRKSLVFTVESGGYWWSAEFKQDSNRFMNSGIKQKRHGIYRHLMSSSLKSMVKEPTARLSATLNDRIEETTDSMDWTLVALSVLSSGCQKWRGLFFFFCAEFDPRFGAFQIFQAQGDTLCTYHWPRLGALLNFPDPYGPTALREWAEALHMDQIIIIRLSAILYKSWNSRGKVSNIIFKDILRYIKYIILVYTYHIYIYTGGVRKKIEIFTIPWPCLPENRHSVQLKACVLQHSCHSPNGRGLMGNQNAKLVTSRAWVRNGLGFHKTRCLSHLSSPCLSHRQRTIWGTMWHHRAPGQ